MAQAEPPDTGVGRNFRPTAGNSGPDDWALAELAATQHDVVAARQLRALGYSYDELAGRVASGRLHPVFFGVYKFGSPTPTRKGRWMAAVLACGADAALSHRSAVALHGLRPGAGPRDPEVTAPRSRDGQQGLTLHRPRRLAPEDRVVVDGIPVTSIRQTLVHYAAVAPIQQVRLALEAADRRGEIDHPTILWLIEHSRRRRGGRALRQMLATYAEAPLTRSELENRFLAIIRGRGIPEPSCNVIVDGFCVDYCWPGQRLVVELDSLEFHRSRSRFEADRRQDRAHRAAGTEILRFTDHDLRSNAAGTGEELLQALNRACAAASGP